jgi:adenosylcobinamide kinase/adenosylcobinamide-phosphate guanylyltransferase
MRVLVTGGVRSGKSRHAEELLAAEKAVTYVAAGPSAAEDPDPDWAARIAAHQQRRPAGWTTLETRDLAAALGTAGPVLVDCLGTWLTGVLDEHALWESSSDHAAQTINGLVEPAIAALRQRTAKTVLVTNEVGLGVVPAYRSGRLVADLLGLVNQQVAGACDAVHLLVAGRVLAL